MAAIDRISNSSSTFILRIQHLESLLLETYDLIEKKNQEIRVLRHSIGNSMSNTPTTTINSSSPSDVHHHTGAEIDFGVYHENTINPTNTSASNDPKLHALLTERQTKIIHLTSQIKTLTHENKCLQEMNKELITENQDLKHQVNEYQAQVESIREFVERDGQKSTQSPPLMKSRQHKEQRQHQGITVQNHHKGQQEEQQQILKDEYDDDYHRSAYSHHSNNKQQQGNDYYATTKDHDLDEKSSVLARSFTLEELYRRLQTKQPPQTKLYKSESKEILASSSPHVSKDKMWITPKHLQRQQDHYHHHQNPQFEYGHPSTRSFSNSQYSSVNKSRQQQTEHSSPYSNMKNHYNDNNKKKNDDNDDGRILSYIEWRKAEDYKQKLLQKEEELETLKDLLKIK